MPANYAHRMLLKRFTLQVDYKNLFINQMNIKTEDACKKEF